MFILSDLISLPAKDLGLPLPWWHRAPLAFQSGTDVFVALTEPTENRPGEIFVSVLNPNHWESMFRIRCRYAEGPGVISKAFGAVSNWNIALAETVTIEGSRIHQVELICEPFGIPKGDGDLDYLSRNLEKEGFEAVSIERLRVPKPSIVWHRKGFVRGGWVTGRPILRWKNALSEQLSTIGDPKGFDFGHLVVSADTENRVLRYVVPRVGARTVKIEHADEPGALNILTTALLNCGLNVLSSLLKRGGVESDNAELVAVCEPIDVGVSESGLDERIADRLSRLPQDLRAEVRIDSGRRAEEVLYVRQPGEVSVRVPEELRPRVLAVKKDDNIPRRFTVFLSQRFLGERNRRYSNEVREVLKGCGCRVLQAPPKPGATITSFDEVSSIMWAAAAGIVLVADPEKEDELSFSLNLAHEFGFLQGQGKPILLLIENHSKALGDLDRWTNAKGLVAPRFNSADAFDRSHGESIAAKIRKWIQELADAGYRPLITCAEGDNTAEPTTAPDGWRRR